MRMAKGCRISHYLTAYADNELDERTRRKVDRHIASCEDCASELDSILASDRILRAVPKPAVADDRWAAFRVDLSQALDEVDREARRKRARVREARPVYGTYRRRVLATAGAFAAVVLVVVAIGPLGLFDQWNRNANECVVDSIETFSAGYTPMFFTSEDPEMTVIWVFADEVEGGVDGEGPGAR